MPWAAIDASGRFEFTGLRDAEAILFIHAWGTVNAFGSSFIDSGKAKEVGLSEDRFTRVNQRVFH